MRTLKNVVLLGLLMLPLVAPLAGQQQTTRLLVFNNTGTVAELSASVNGAWQSRGRINPGSSMPVYNVKNGDLFRAVWRGGDTQHTVQLRYDRAYGGYQDTWSLPY